LNMAGPLQHWSSCSLGLAMMLDALHTGVRNIAKWPYSITQSAIHVVYVVYDEVYIDMKVHVILYCMYCCVHRKSSVFVHDDMYAATDLLM